jgi:hypothetical protein
MDNDAGIVLDQRGGRVEKPNHLRFMLLIVIIAFLFSTLSNAGTVLDGIRTVFIESDYPLAVSQLTNELHRLGIAVVERREIDKLFHEQRFRLQHGSDADTDRMRIGQMAGADAMLSLEVRAGDDVIRQVPADRELRQEVQSRLNALKIAAQVDLRPKAPPQPPGISFWDWQVNPANRTPNSPPLLPKLNALNTILQMGGIEKTIGINEYYADGADWETVLLHDPTTSPNWEEANDRLIGLHPGVAKTAAGRLPNWKEIVEREHQRQHAKSIEATKRRSDMMLKPQTIFVHIRVISVETGKVIADGIASEFWQHKFGSDQSLDRLIQRLVQNVIQHDFIR